MKILLIIFTLLGISNSAHAGEKMYEVKFKNDKHEEKFYWDNIKKATDDQIILVPNKTLNCFTKKAYKKAYSTIISGMGTPMWLASINCFVTNSMKRALIVEAYKDSNMIKLVYRIFYGSPHNTQVRSAYFSTSGIMSKRDYDKQFN